MNARDKIKPKTIRMAILMALADGAIVTIDDLQSKTDEPRTKIATNVYPAAIEGLIKRLRDDVTGGPAYQITAKGREYLRSFEVKKEEVKSPAPVVKDPLTTEFNEQISHITPGVKVDVSESAADVISERAAEIIGFKDAEIERIQADKEVLVRNANQTFDAMRGQQERIAELESELGQARTVAKPPESAISSQEIKPLLVELISEESFIVKVGSHEFPRMRLISSWEGMRKLGNPEGHWIIVMKTAGPLGGFFEDIFRPRDGTAGEKVIPVCGSDYFQKAFEQVSGGKNDTQVQSAA